MATIKFGTNVETMSLMEGSSHKHGIDQLMGSFFPEKVQALLRAVPWLQGIQEIRCRLNRPIILMMDNKQWLIKDGGQVFRLQGEDFNFILQRINQCSVYAWEEEYRRGYLTLPGGHRVGLAGKALLSHGEIRTMKDISSLNFRIAKEIKGAATQVMPYVIWQQQVLNTLIVAPPGCGKTTMLRDIVRQLSNGVPALQFEGVNVGVVDERSELAGTVQGEAQLDLGIRTDILDGCPKSQGMVMLIRSMSPTVLVTDELGTAQDVAALEEVLNAGIAVITTIHGHDWQDLEKRPHFNQLIRSQFFERIIFLSKQHGVGSIDKIYKSHEGNYLLIN